MAGLALMVGCGGGASPGGTGSAIQPTEPKLLSINSPTKDEDPSVIRRADGSMLVAWFSDRGGNPDIYVAASIAGADFGAPVRVTTSPAGDFYPNLFLDDQGLYHLVWFRWTSNLVGSIWHNTSADGLAWNPATEEAVTSVSGVDDWVPTLTQRADGALLVYFVSSKRDPTNPTSELYVVTRDRGQPGWSAATRAASINSPTEHDHLPFAARTGDHITLIWTRSDTRQSVPWLNPKADLYAATSADGLAWSSPVRITNDRGDIVNVFPALYPNFAGTWSLVFLSTRQGQPKPFAFELAKIANYPDGLVELSELPAGYSHRIAPTATPGVFLGVWVQGAEGEQDIYYRYFRR
jgi:hypothetical protein